MQFSVALPAGNFHVIKTAFRRERPNEFAAFADFLERTAAITTREADLTALARWAFNGGDYTDPRCINQILHPLNVPLPDNEPTESVAA